MNMDTVSKRITVDLIDAPMGVFTDIMEMLQYVKLTPAEGQIVIVEIDLSLLEGAKDE